MPEIEVLLCVHMERIGIRELRQNASTWVSRAAAGERIEISRRGEVVAVLGPPTVATTVERLRAEGRLRSASSGPADMPAARRTRQSVSAALTDLRDDER